LVEALKTWFRRIVVFLVQVVVIALPESELPLGTAVTFRDEALFDIFSCKRIL